MADIESRMEKTVNALKEEYNSIRTGRANASILESKRQNLVLIRETMERLSAFQFHH